MTSIDHHVAAAEHHEEAAESYRKAAAFHAYGDCQQASEHARLGKDRHTSRRMPSSCNGRLISDQAFGGVNQNNPAA